MCLSIDTSGSSGEPAPVARSGSIEFLLGAPPGIPGGAIMRSTTGDIVLCCAPVGVLRMDVDGARRLSLALARASGSRPSWPSWAILAVTTVVLMLCGWGISAWIGAD